MTTVLPVIGIFGAGRLGLKIGTSAAANGHSVYLYDSFPKQLAKAEQILQTAGIKTDSFKTTLKKTADFSLPGIHIMYDLTKFGDCDIIFETVAENMEIKRDVFMRIEAIAKRNCIFCCCSASLPFEEIAETIKKPRRFLGARFLSENAELKLLELRPISETEPSNTEIMEKLMKRWQLP